MIFSSSSKLSLFHPIHGLAVATRKGKGGLVTVAACLFSCCSLFWATDCGIAPAIIDHTHQKTTQQGAPAPEKTTGQEQFITAS